MSMADPADDSWKKMVKAQPAVTDADRAAGAAPRAESFAIELTDDGLLLKIRRTDGKIAMVELSPDMALYLREYLTNGLASIGYIQPRS